MSVNRKRCMTITIRVTPEEKAAIDRKVKQANMSLTDYLVTAAQSTHIFVAENLKPVLTELKRIGNNLNQLAMKINAGAFQSYNFSEVIAWQSTLCRCCKPIAVRSLPREKLMICKMNPMSSSPI